MHTINPYAAAHVSTYVMPFLECRTCSTEYATFYTAQYLAGAIGETISSSSSLKELDWLLGIILAVNRLIKPKE